MTPTRYPLFLFFVSLLIGSTLGAAALGAVLRWQGAQFSDAYGVVVGAVLVGVMSAAVTYGASGRGHNGPFKTALWSGLLWVGSLAILMLKWALIDHVVSGKAIVFTCAIGATLTVCSTLSIWLMRIR